MSEGGPSLPRRALAEGLGTFALVFVGCGAIVTDAARPGALGVVGLGLAFFLVLLAAIASLGHVSGAHFNPGVSLSFFLTRHLPAHSWSRSVLTAFLMLVIMRTATDSRGVGAPAALAAGQRREFWLYVAGPLLGAPLGAFAYQVVRGEHPVPAHEAGETA